MKKSFSVMAILLLLSMSLMACTGQQEINEGVPGKLEEGISDVDSVEEDVYQQEIDSELDSLEQDFDNW